MYLNSTLPSLSQSDEVELLSESSEQLRTVRLSHWLNMSDSGSLLQLIHVNYQSIYIFFLTTAVGRCLTYWKQLSNFQNNSRIVQDPIYDCTCIEFKLHSNPLHWHAISTIEVGGCPQCSAKRQEPQYLHQSKAQLRHLHPLHPRDVR